MLKRTKDAGLIRVIEVIILAALELGPKPLDELVALVKSRLGSSREAAVDKLWRTVISSLKNRNMIQFVLGGKIVELGEQGKQILVSADNQRRKRG